LGIFIEALPFLLLGVLASALIEVFVSADAVRRLMPKGVLGALVGSGLGLAFPVCECGVIPVTRRLYGKGLPLPAGVAFMLAGPVINPVVIASTAIAFSQEPALVIYRLLFTILIAVLAASAFKLATPAEVLHRLPVPAGNPAQAVQSTSLFSLLRTVLANSAEELFEMGSYLVLGGAVAAAMQTFIPQSAILAIGSGTATSVPVMMLLAVLLSICSTVDSFVALSFLGTFTSGAVLAFLVFGPMIDIKSTIMYARVFRPRAVAAIIGVVALGSFLAGVVYNYYLR